MRLGNGRLVIKAGQLFDCMSIAQSLSGRASTAVARPRDQHQNAIALLLEKQCRDLHAFIKVKISCWIALRWPSLSANKTDHALREKSQPLHLNQEKHGQSPFECTSSISTLQQCCTKEKHDFVCKIFLASGISTTRTALPKCLLPEYSAEPKTDLLNAQEEARMIYGQVISEVLRKTGVLLSCLGMDNLQVTDTRWRLLPIGLTQ